MKKRKNHRGTGLARAGIPTRRVPDASAARAGWNARRRNRRAPRRAVPYALVPSEPPETRGPGDVPARQPLDHLQRRLQSDERFDFLPDGELLAREFGTVRAGGLQARASDECPTKATPCGKEKGERLSDCGDGESRI